MNNLILYTADIAAICVLTFGIYFRRHRRRDLLVALLGVNAGVLAVTAVLATSSIGAGLGLGLFGVLSIIRLRSSELEQPEVAYYFSALALGLLGGLGSTNMAVSLALMGVIIVVMFLAGNARLYPRYRHQVMLLDTAYTDEAALTRHLEVLLGGRVHQVGVQKVDLANDTTLVDVRFEVSDVRHAEYDKKELLLSRKDTIRLNGAIR